MSSFSGYPMPAPVIRRGNQSLGVGGPLVPGQSVMRSPGMLPQYARASGPLLSGGYGSAPQIRQQANAPLLSPQNIAAADSAQTGDDERNRMLGNLGIGDRGPTPQFKSMQAGIAQRAANPAPMIDPAIVARAHENNLNFRPNPGSIQMTEQLARRMWTNILQNHGADYGKAQDEFIQMGKDHGFDAHEPLEKWKQEGSLLQTSFAQPGMTAAPKPISDAPILSSAFGTNYATPGMTTGAHTGLTADGRSVLVDGHGQQVGPDLGRQAPVARPMMGINQPGYTPLRTMSNGYTTQPRNSSPMLSDSGSSQPATPMMSSPPSAPIIDPSQLPQFPKSENMLQNAIDVPVRAAEAKGQSVVDAQTARGQGMLDVQKEKDASGERQTTTKANATTQAAATNTQGRIEIGKGNNAATVTVGKGHDAATTQAAGIRAAAPGRGGVTGQVRPTDLNQAFAHFQNIPVPNEAFDKTKPAGVNNARTRFPTAEEATAMAYAFHGMKPPTTQSSAGAAPAATPGPVTRPSTEPATDPSENTVPMIRPDGTPVHVHPEDVQGAIQNGYKQR